MRGLLQVRLLHLSNYTGSHSVATCAVFTSASTCSRRRRRAVAHLCAPVHLPSSGVCPCPYPDPAAAPHPAAEFGDSGVGNTAGGRRSVRWALRSRRPLLEAFNENKHKIYMSYIEYNLLFGVDVGATTVCFK